jgi:hypothetical protein
VTRNRCGVADSAIAAVLAPIPWGIKLPLVDTERIAFGPVLRERVVALTEVLVLECPAIADQPLAEVLATDGALGNDTIVGLALALAHHGAASDSLRQGLRSIAAAAPLSGLRTRAALGRLRGIHAPHADALAADLEGVAVDDGCSADEIVFSDGPL